MKVRLFKLSAVKLCGRAFIVKLNRIGSIVPVEAELMQLAMESSEERPWRVICPNIISLIMLLVKCPDCISSALLIVLIKSEKCQIR